MDIVDLIITIIESTAEWRREKGEEFSVERERNLQAASELDQLAKDINSLSESELDPYLQWLNIVMKDSLRMIEWLSEELRAIEFRTSYNNGSELLQACAKEAQRLMSEGETARLEEQVENAPTVKAAKRAYLEARAKAYAEARKQLL